MGIYLDVPFCTQIQAANASSPLNDPTGCWYASITMIGWYFEVGPRQGVPELHSSNLPPDMRRRLGFTGHFAIGSNDGNVMMQRYGGGRNAHELLLERERLTTVNHCDEPYAYSFAELERLLRRFGPIYFQWMKTAKGQTYGHASVLVGVLERTPELVYHDPENGPRSTMTIADFNRKRQVFQYALLRRMGTPHQIREYRG